MNHKKLLYKNHSSEEQEDFISKTLKLECFV